MKIYFLSGLGADRTVFQFLNLPPFEPVFIDWIKPQMKETLPKYAIRLKEQFIPPKSVIVGLSFGGMLATEMAKKFPDLQVILLSAAKVRSELPWYYNIGKWLPFHRFSPSSLQINTMLHMKWLFGLKSPVAEKIYEALIKRSDTKFNAWAIESILSWSNTVIPSNIYHIHGTADRVLPVRNIKADLLVENGGHLMVLEQAEIISDILLNRMQTIELQKIAEANIKS